jgi:uncharacterized protein YndB with AHSA1/START domain
MSGTVQLHRVLTAPPERVYRAFIDPEAMVKWLPPAEDAIVLNEVFERIVKNLA